LERSHENIKIVVSDTGKGIEPEFLPHIFEISAEIRDGLAQF